MANVIHLRCHYCGDPLQNRDETYCPECNLYLAYRAMPFLLGMILTGHLATDLAKHSSPGLPEECDDMLTYEEETALILE